MAPIRIALVGLSQSAKTSWASEGHLPYLLSDRGRERYQIRGLLNSSVDAAKRAIESYKLPAETKAYKSPQDVADDPDIDLIVVATRVDNHYDNVKPSIAAGKAAFVEWPLAENKTRAAELADLAREKGSRTIIGLQARVAPAVLKVKEIVQSGELGKVLSSSVQSFSPFSDRDTISDGLSYFLDKKVGGNPLTIVVGHSMSWPGSLIKLIREAYLITVIDYIHSVLGEYATSHSHVQVQRPHQTIVNKEAGSERATTSDVPDLLSIHGTLHESPYVARGASLVVDFRKGPSFPGTKPFVWTIHCEKGEIRVSNERGPFLQSEASAYEIPIEVEDFATGQVRTVGWSWEEWQLSLLSRGRNIGKVYDLYAEGRLAEMSCADFDSAVERHRQLDAILYAD